MAKWTTTTPWVKSNKKTEKEWPKWVCRNPQCKSYHHSHPGCLCGPPGSSTDRSANPSSPQYAEGGEVHFCSYESPHEKNCQYFAEGGPVEAAPLQAEENDQPEDTLGHVAIQHGLIGLLEGGIGHASLEDPEKHARVIDDAKAQYRHMSNGPAPDGLEEQGPPKSIGTEIGEKMFHGQHSDSAEKIHGSPLVGGASKTNLEPILKRLAKPMLEKETNPEALRSAVEYLHSSAKGSHRLDEDISKVLDPHEYPKHMVEMSRENARKDLKEKLMSVQANPSQLLEVGGSLGHYLPNHATQLGVTLAQATQYLDSIKPKAPPQQPLDNSQHINPVDQDKYNRQLDIANQPMMVLEHISSGTLQPQDLVTLKTLYPGLEKAMIQKLQEHIIKSKSDGIEIPYRKRGSLSLILGQPLDSTYTPDSMQAILNSAPKASQAPQGKPKGQGKIATAQTQKTIEKTDQLYETPLDSLQMKKK